MSYSTGLQPTFQNVPLVVPGKRLFLLGSSNSDNAQTSAFVTNVTLAGGTGTFSLALTGGAIPVVGQTFGIQQCSVSAANGTGYVIVTVSGFNSGDNSVGVVTASVAGTQGSIASTGNFIGPNYTVPDVCQDGTSLYVTLPYNDPRIDQSRTINFQVSFPSIPTTALVTAQQSDDGVTFFPIGDVASVTGGVVSNGFLTVSAQSAKFYNLLVSGVTGGTLPTIWATISA